MRRETLAWSLAWSQLRKESGFVVRVRKINVVKSI